jgi:hypothetical protein
MFVDDDMLCDVQFSVAINLAVEMIAARPRWM